MKAKESYSVFNKYHEQAHKNTNIAYTNLTDIVAYDYRGFEIESYSKGLDFYATHDHEPLNVVLWRKKDSTIHKYKSHTLTPDKEYFIGVDKECNESILYLKKGKYFDYATNRPFDLFIWRDISNIKDFKMYI